MITISWYFLILIAIITGLWIFTFARDSSSGEGNRYGNNRRKSEGSGNNDVFIIELDKRIME